jgi:hypothetical protein
LKKEIEGESANAELGLPAEAQRRREFGKMLLKPHFMTDLFEFPDAIKEYVRNNVNSNDVYSIEKVLLYLKHKGISQFGSVYLLNTECGIPVHRANLYVMDSKAWNSNK